MIVIRITTTEVVGFNAVEYSKFSPTRPLMTPYRPLTTYSIAQADYQKMREERYNDGVKILEQTKEIFEELELDLETRLIEGKDSAEYAISQVEEEKFDLLVIGCKVDPGKLERVFLGTTAQKLLNESSCDLMVVR